ncbi:cob(I)yrinic acid a,c-diamide adenosyltransferase [Pusillimonas sp.]|uniref:cob(I)yrinic acid a,c-diamide adenosyltransferase n=1 Tax=Pusillimonas sp. TaxID=3040095 RepID=UPI0037C68CCA
MATRLSIITTRGGDQGMTSLGDGGRISKDAPRIAAMGDVDELNSMLGLLRAEALPDDVDAVLACVQNDLFDLGAELCIPGHTAVTEKQVIYLEQTLARYNADLGALREFILPGGTRAAALAHVARTVCRRAERSVFAMEKTDAAASEGPLGEPARFLVQYLNRLSDLCFVLARALNRAAGRPDVLWNRESDADSNSPR